MWLAHVSRANLVGLGIAILYGLTSASMAFVNKVVLTSYHFNYPIFLVVVQMLVSIIALETLRVTGLISLPSYSLERGRSFFLPSLFYALHSVLALWALSGMNIPMYGVLKRCGPLVILLLGTVLLKKGRPPCIVASAISSMTLGCIIAGYGDLAFNMEDYFICGVSVICQSLYLVLVQMSSQQLSATETLHLNSYNTLPLLLGAAVVFSEFQEGAKHFLYNDAGFLFMFWLVVCMGCMLNYLLFLCTTYNSALTTSIMGTLKSIVQTSIGMFTFGGVAVNLFTMLGIAMNLSGGVLYSYAKYSESKQKSDGTLRKVHSLETIENGKSDKDTAHLKENGYTQVQHGEFEQGSTQHLSRENV